MVFFLKKLHILVKLRSVNSCNYIELNQVRLDWVLVNISVFHSFLYIVCVGLIHAYN